MEQKSKDKYIDFINEINNGIVEFSNYLNPKIEISPFENNLVNKPFTPVSWNLADTDWKEKRDNFSHSESSGVYFIFGRENKDDNRFGVYVGKSSIFIGGRLYEHINSGYQWNYGGNFFTLEFVVIIPMDNYPFMASSLEDFFIGYLSKKGILLFNEKGIIG